LETTLKKSLKKGDAVLFSLGLSCYQHMLLLFLRSVFVSYLIVNIKDKNFREKAAEEHTWTDARGGR
jgi:hypothetical protein